MSKRSSNSCLRSARIGKRSGRRESWRGREGQLDGASWTRSSGGEPGRSRRAVGADTLSSCRMGPTEGRNDLAFAPGFSPLAFVASGAEPTEGSVDERNHAELRAFRVLVPKCAVL